MKRGIRFCIPNEWGNFLAQILDSFPLKSFVWKICNSDVFINKTESYMEDGIYTGAEIENMISEKCYYGVHIDIFAYPQNGELHSYVQNLNNVKYKEFLKSECELAIFIDDCSYVCIYAKDSNLYSLFKKNFDKYGFTDWEDIEEKNDYYFNKTTQIRIKGDQIEIRSVIGVDNSVESSEYKNAYLGYGKVAYIDGLNLIVRDIFDKSTYYREFERTILSGYKLANARFLDQNHLEIECSSIKSHKNSGDFDKIERMVIDLG